MDRSIYTAMTGANTMLQRQDALANNLANASTNGFRADLMAFRSVPVRADGTATTRVDSLEATTGFDTASGPMQTTGRPLDVAVQGDGWIAVQANDGTEAYTRNGALVLSGDGVLQTSTGHDVVGEGGPITIPPGMTPSIGRDGTVSASAKGQPSVAVGKIKLANPAVSDLTKGTDGLIRTKSGDPAAADPTVKLADGVLEGSNVNVVSAMVGMIALSRQFQMQMQMLQTNQTNDQKASELLALKS